MHTYVVGLGGQRLLLAQARDEEHLRETLRELGEDTNARSWARYTGPVDVQMQVPIRFSYPADFDARDGSAEEMLAVLVEHASITRHVRTDDPIPAELAAALFDPACPNAGSVIMAAHRRADPADLSTDIRFDARQLRAALREDLRASGRLPTGRPRQEPDVPRLNLYWVETDDHDEDWFIVAASPTEACRDHEAREGYEVGDASAEFVAAVPADAPDRGAGWPSDELLRACGGAVECSAAPRVVRFGRRTFAEGLLDAEIRALDDDLSERLGRGRPNGTPPRASN